MADTGRPHKYLPIMDTWLIEHYSRGGSFETFNGFMYHKSKKILDADKKNGTNTAEQLGFKEPVIIGKSTLYDWCNKDHSSYVEKFSETKKEMLPIAEYFWQEIAVRDDTINATKWVFSMKNRFGWKDRTDITSNDKNVGNYEDYNMVILKTLEIIKGKEDGDRNSDSVTQNQS